ncbi:uncharacterized protein LOC128302796 [Anopheles moucheti]|uniref:uncharacterized protein LOC128302796 n=1 Tax=Anopheles moucheti TaxID=186751 RepID=UPI0022F10AF4|nr:uncharacterized protein LOC128302796 [Anopheles moucheti]
MGDPLNQHGRKKLTPSRSVRMKEEPEPDLEPEIEFLRLASSWDSSIRDPLNDEIAIGETVMANEDPFMILQEFAIKTEPDADTEDCDYAVESSPKKKKKSDDAKLAYKSTDKKNQSVSSFMLPQNNNINQITIASNIVSPISASSSNVNLVRVPVFDLPHNLNYRIVAIPSLPGSDSTGVLIPTETGKLTTKTKSEPVKVVVPTSPTPLHIDEKANVTPNFSNGKCCNHKELLRQSEHRLKQLEGENALLKKQLAAKLNAALRYTSRKRQTNRQEERVVESIPREGLIPRTNFMLGAMENEAELESFENLLMKDEEYKQEVYNFLKNQIFCKDVNNRLHQAIDLLFSKPFFANITWTGCSRTNVPKVELRKFTNVIDMFRRIGSNETVVPTPKYVADFLKLKLKHAKSRIHIVATKMTSCHQKHRGS